MLPHTKIAVVVSVSILMWCGKASAIDVGRLPGNTITNEKGTTLQYGLRNKILENEVKHAPGCRNPRISGTEIIGQPNTGGRNMRWSERWTVDHCGLRAVYVIHFDFHGSVGTYKVESPRRDQ